MVGRDCVSNGLKIRRQIGIDARSEGHTIDQGQFDRSTTRAWRQIYIDAELSRSVETHLHVAVKFGCTHIPADDADWTVVILRRTSGPVNAL